MSEKKETEKICGSHYIPCPAVKEFPLKVRLMKISKGVPMPDEEEKITLEEYIKYRPDVDFDTQI